MKRPYVFSSAIRLLYIAFWILNLVSVNEICAQSTFQRVYNLNYNSAGFAIGELSNDQYVVGVMSPALLPSSSYLVWINSTGDTTRTLPICGGIEDLAVTPENEIVVAGRSRTCSGFPGDVGVNRYDSLGQLISFNHYGNAGIDRGTSLCLNPDGSMLVACDNSSYPDLLKIDSTGNLLWGRTFGVNALNSVKPSKIDNGYYVCGWAGSAFIDPLYVAKTDSDGFVQWYRTFYENGLGDEINDIIPQDDGSVLAISNYSFLYRIGANGDSLWRRSIAPAGSLRFIQTSDGNLVYIASTSFIAKTDTAGNLIWSRFYPYFANPAYNRYAAYRNLMETHDGGLLFCGYTDSLGNQDLMILKTDSAGLLQSTGLQAGAPEVRVQLWPNPAVEACHFMLHNYHYQGAPPLLFTLFDVQGRILHQQSVTQWPFVLSRGNFPTGACLYRFTSKQHYIAGGVMVWN